MSNTMKVWHTETDTIVAADRDDAIAVLVEQYGHGTVEAEDLVDELREDRGDPNRLKTIVDGDTGERNTKTLSQWVAENGRGLLCSTEY